MDYIEYLNSSCPDEQLAWQLKEVSVLTNLHIVIRNDLNAFNQFHSANKPLFEEATVVMGEEWLKILDSIILLVKYGKFDISITLVRSLLEVTLQIAYMLQEDKELKAAYYYNHSFIKAYMYNKRLFEGKTDTKSVEFLRKNDTLINRCAASGDNLVVEVHNKLVKDNAPVKEALGTTWFSLYSQMEKKKRLSIESLLEEVASIYDPDKERVLLKERVLYDFLSVHTHGYFAPLNSVVINNVQKFRNYECVEYAGWIIDTIFKISMLLCLALSKGNLDFEWKAFDSLQDISGEINLLRTEWYEKFIKD